MCILWHNLCMIFLIIVSVLILVETSFLTVRSFKLPRSGSSKRKIYVDTSALMDGRILKIAKAGFLGDNLIIPRSVIRELQLLADGNDSEKRSRARLGMDNANELERVILTNVEILDDVLDHTPVDERLIELAKANRGLILTCDYNLQKVAETEKIDVLNPNELATELKSEHLPGDVFKLKITGVGSNPKQGVGYLPEGTMVVVEGASKKVGKEVEVIFDKYIQTNSGRMMFAKVRANRRQIRGRGRGNSK